MTNIKKVTDKHGNITYEFQLYIGTDPLTGKQHRTRRRGFKSLDEAKIVLARLQLELLEGGTLKKDHYTTFQEVYDLWFQSYKTTVKESTWVTTSRIFKLHILPIFKNYRIGKITTKDCQKAIDTWFKNKLVQYRRYLDYTSKVLDFAINMGELQDNPARYVIKPVDRDRKHHASLENYYDKQQLQTLLEGLSKEYDYQPYAFFRLLAFSGMRKGEALALQWSDVDYKKGEISITKTQSRGNDNKLVIQTPKTEKSTRVVTVDDKTAKIMRRWQIKQKEYFLNFGSNINRKNNFVFSNQNNRMHQPVKPQKWLASAIKKYQLPKITVHGFRHTYATLAFEAGAPIKAVQEQLGHESYKTTMDIYTAVTESQKGKATQKLANYLNF